MECGLIRNMGANDSFEIEEHDPCIYRNTYKKFDATL